MERVCFLLDDTGQRISCLLNPDSVVVRRAAGVRTRDEAGGRLTGSGLADDPVHFTGGGRTEIELDLLFDTSLAGSTIASQDVKELTGPLWELSENYAGADGAARLRSVRLVWGKAWNVEGFVTAVAERFERFDPFGAPQRSWLRMRLLRTGRLMATSQVVPQAAVGYALPPASEIAEDEVIVHEVVGGEPGDEAGGGERLDLIAARYYGEPSLWRVLAAFNGVTDPTRIPPPRTVRVPPLSALRML
jgi:hypothetical protein